MNWLSRKRGAKALQREDLRTKVAANRLAGATQREIAQMLGISQPTVSRLLAEIEAEWRKETTAAWESRRLRAARRIDIAINAIWSRAVSGDLQAIDRFIKLQDQECRLFGLYAPTSTAAVVVQASVNANVKIDFDNLSDEAAEALGAFWRALERQQSGEDAEPPERVFQRVLGAG